MERIVIEDNCIFGECVKIYDHNHRFSNLNKKIAEQGYSLGEIYIEKNCWIGSNVVILKGVHIGEGSVIGANCTISEDLSPLSVVTVKGGISERVGK